MDRKQILKEADSIEASAKDGLQAWSILGETKKYEQHMQKAADLRRAAELTGQARKEFMRNKGLM